MILLKSGLFLFPIRHYKTPFNLRIGVDLVTYSLQSGKIYY
nr:MAG TPA: hypothetical protein [Caudoviricetes sp.]